MTTNMITFPNLGLGPWFIDPVAIVAFGKDIMWYGVIITAAIICGVLYVMRRAKREKLLEDDVLDYALIVVTSAILCARLYYVIFDPDPHYESFMDVIAIWEGGLAIYGGIIGGALAVFFVSKWKGVYFSRFADMICPAVMIGQAIGRWGNFTNGEAYGSVTKFDFIFRSFDISESALASPLLMNVNGVNAQPTFLYESVWNIIGFILIITVINKKRIFAGMTALFYFAWYGFGRMFIEGLRTDSLYIPGSNTLRVSQLIGALTFAFALAAIIILSIRAKKMQKCFDVNAPVYYGKRLAKLEADGFYGEKDKEDTQDDATAKTENEEVNKNTEEKTEEE